ncbi:MAG: elongation factor P [Candidatus Dojkabacteria bacterium]
MINSNDLRPGSVFKDNGETFLVLKYSHMKKGRGQATIRVKVKNISTRSIVEKSYTNEQKVEEADVEKRTAQFLYADDSNAYFMDTADYSQFQLNKEEIEWELNFLKEGGKSIATFLEGNAISIEIPKSVELGVVKTTDAVAGNTSSGATKEAQLETGYSAQVPLFIKEGEVLKINTESGYYVSRVN